MEKRRTRLSSTDEAKRFLEGFRKTIDHFFPDIWTRFSEVPDPRVGHEYSICEIVFASVSMFIFKQGSRNAMNNDRKFYEFSRNFESVFGLRLPHMDTVDTVIRRLSSKELDRLRKSMIRTLLSGKVLSKFRLLGEYYMVAIDATGVMQVNEGHCSSCLHKTHNRGKANEKTSFFHNVLEAKLICENGFSISLETEWIENNDDYEKQDCELNSFKRLAERLKKAFPRLKICLVADSLYPNAPFFELCESYGWSYIVVFKDGCLPTLWEQVDMELLTSKNQRSQITPLNTEQTFRWLSGLKYGDTELSWLECTEKDFRFVFVTNLTTDYYTVRELIKAGRLRAGIEDSFNTQKNRGYDMQHKYSRSSMKATKNYYLCMQIAHIINQLFELGSLCRPYRERAKLTVKQVWKQIMGLFRMVELPELMGSKLGARNQVRFE